MQPVLNAIGIELIVDDMDRSLELFNGILGCEVLSRGPSPVVAGEAALVDANGLMISLLCPGASGDGSVLSEREPRLSQLIFAADDQASSEEVFRRASEAGMSLGPAGDGRFYLTPESVDGALGQPVAVMVTAIDPE